jgi:hypothetical protein
MDFTDSIGNALFKIGVLDLKAGRWRESIAALTPVIEAAPTWAHPYDALAATWAGAGDPARGAEIAQRGLALARAAGNQPLAARLASRLAAYQRAPTPP